MTRVKQSLAFGIIPVLAWTGVALAQDDALPDSHCPTPDATTDVVICPESSVTNGDQAFVETQIFVRDARYGWLRLTPCEDVVTTCDRIYLEGAIDTSESIEVSLDDPGDGQASK